MRKLLLRIKPHSWFAKVKWLVFVLGGITHSILYWPEKSYQGHSRIFFKSSVSAKTKFSKNSLFDSCIFKTKFAVFESMNSKKNIQQKFLIAKISSLEVVLRPQKEDLLTTKKNISICYKGYARGENDLPQAELNLSLTNSENFTGRLL